MLYLPSVNISSPEFLLLAVRQMLKGKEEERAIFCLSGVTKQIDSFSICLVGELCERARRGLECSFRKLPPQGRKHWE